jgi:CDGSH-type Zn-finger protein
MQSLFGKAFLALSGSAVVIGGCGSSSNKSHCSDILVGSIEKVFEDRPDKQLNAQCILLDNF